MTMIHTRRDFSYGSLPYLAILQKECRRPESQDDNPLTLYKTAGYAAVVQGIELSNTIRISAYTFNIINNKITIFPIPSDSDTREGFLWFEYIKVQDRINNSITQPSGSDYLVTNPSNAPYTNPNYSLVNSIGRQWIFEYTLALCKEMLGYVRGKYSTVPIPDQNMTLN